jgi:hypothetical protein
MINVPSGYKVWQTVSTSGGRGPYVLSSEPPVIRDNGDRLSVSFRDIENVHDAIAAFDAARSTICLDIRPAPD